MIDLDVEEYERMNRNKKYVVDSISFDFANEVTRYKLVRRQHQLQRYLRELAEELNELILPGKQIVTVAGYIDETLRTAHSLVERTNGLAERFEHPVISELLIDAKQFYGALSQQVAKTYSQNSQVREVMDRALSRTDAFPLLKEIIESQKRLQPADVGEGELQELR
jgi:hypothetical protein